MILVECEWDGFISMDLRRRVVPLPCGVILALLFALLVGMSEGSRRALKSVGGNNGDDGALVGVIDEFEAERILSNCRQEVMVLKHYIQDLDFFFAWEANGVSNEANSEAALLRRRYWHAVVTSLPHYLKQYLLVCSRSVGSSSSTYLIEKYVLDMLHDQPSAQRRYLVSNTPAFQHPQRLPSVMASVSSPFVATSLSPSRLLSLSPSSSPLEPHSPSPALVVPSGSPSSSPLFSPPAEAPEEPSSPPSLNPPPSPFLRPISVPPRKPLSQVASASDNGDAHKKVVLIALIALMSAATIILAVLLIYLLKNKRNKVGLRCEQKDDRPLLNLSSSDLSAGSSQNSQGFESPQNSKKFHITSGEIHSANVPSAAADGTLGVKSSGTISGNTDGAVKGPPPVKSATPSPSAPPPAPAPRPPPPPKGVCPPSPPGRSKPLPPKGCSDADNSKGEAEAPKAKLKPFFWDKVQTADDQSMVWHELKAGSFQVNEEMMESLFGYAPMDKNNVERKKESPSLDNVPQYIKIIDPKKAQNLSILLRALNVTTEEVCDALQEGNELPTELIQTLIKMAPSADEELKLRLYNGELSHLGPAERFLKRMVQIPHAFKRLESLLLMGTYPEELINIKESHETLEVACDKLKNSRLFLKLLEAVLKTGNRMNDGTYRGGAQAFKLDTLLKLSDVKGTDGKTTLLHFVVQEMIRSEGIRAVRVARESQSVGSSDLKVDELTNEYGEKTEEYYQSLGLQVVSGLSMELEYVKKAAVIDADGLKTSVAKLGHALQKIRDFLNTDMKNLDEDSEFRRKLASFVEQAEAEIPHHIEQEKRIMALIKSTADYFHGNAGREEGLHLFIIVRDFLIMLDKVCNGIQHSLSLSKAHPPMKQDSTASDSSTKSHEPRTQFSDIQQRLFPAIQERRMDDTISDEDSS